MNGLPSIVNHAPAWSTGVGLGCACNQKSDRSVELSGIQARFSGLSGVSDYDIIRIGGGNYTANQILDKYIRANATTKIYFGTSGKPETVIGTVKGGDIIGKVFSYLRSDQSADGRSWLMFDRSDSQKAAAPQYGNYFFVPNEAVSTGGLKDQGTKTVTEEVKQEEDDKEKLNNPVEYYLNKYGGKLVLAVGVILIINGIARESIKGSFAKKEVSPQP